MTETFRRLMLKFALVVGVAVAVCSALLIVTLPLYMPYLLALAGR